MLWRKATDQAAQGRKKGRNHSDQDLVAHIMESGQRRDKDGKIIPRMIINSFLLRSNGTPVFPAVWNPPSQPIRTCNFAKGRGERTFRFSWVMMTERPITAEEKTAVT